LYLLPLRLMRASQAGLIKSTFILTNRKKQFKEVIISIQSFVQKAKFAFSRVITVYRNLSYLAVIFECLINRLNHIRRAIINAVEVFLHNTFPIRLAGRGVVIECKVKQYSGNNYIYTAAEYSNERPLLYTKNL
jgi:hypothetical protein